MATQTSIFTLKGKISGVSFYKKHGVDYARRASGNSKAIIHTAPNFQRTRENMSEFGGAATAAKALRKSIAPAAKKLSDTFVTARLLRVFKAINLKDTGTRGQRSFTVSANQSMLLDFEFNNHVPLTSIMRAPFTVVANAARNQSTLSVHAFDPAVFITPALGATHFRLVFALGTISDYVYNPTEKKYEPAAPAINSLSAVIYSPYLPLTALTADQSLVADLPAAPILTPQVSAVAFLGIEFSQLIGAVQYPLHSDEAMKIVALF